MSKLWLIEEADGAKSADQLWALLGHHVRRSILHFMAERGAPVSPGELAPELRVGRQRLRLSDLSYHFRFLAREGALDLVAEEPVGGSTKHLYSINPQFMAQPLVAALVAGLL